MGAIGLRSAALAAVVLVVAAPVYLYLEPPWRPLVARLAAALVLGAALLQLRRAVADRLAGTEPSPLDQALSRPGPAPAVPLRFQDLMSDVRTARRSRRYFDKILWPRLAALSPRPLAPPPPRTGRGPTLRDLRAVIAEIERQP